MNSDLAYCLERFIDDQIQLIDDRLETVKEQETVEYRRIEQLKVSQLAQKKPTANRGSHDEDEAIVQRFIQRLFDIAEDDTANNIENYKDILRTELNEKLSDCSKYVKRMRNLAKPILGSENFILKCNEIIGLLNHEQKISENYNELCQVIEQSNAKDVVENVQQWWEKMYGSFIMEINHLNKRFTPGISNNDMAIIPSRGGMVSHAKRILSVGNDEILVDSQKYEIISKFVRQIRSIDDESRHEINEDELINELNNNNIDSAIDYAVKWLEKRDTQRNSKEEEDISYDALWEEAKVKFDCQRIAQQTKKLSLATLLRRLAIGSNHTEQFDQKLKTTIEKQKQGDGIPVMIGDIREPNVEKMPMSIHLEEADINEWTKNINRIQDQFSSSLCRAFDIPDTSIRITEVKYGSVIIIAYVLPPYGSNVIDCLNGVASDSPARIKAVRKCCLAVKGKIESITLGDCGLSIDHKLMDPMWNRIYAWSNKNSNEGQFWEKPLNRGGKPYFCPAGWQRFGMQVAENEKAFDARWGNWYLGYHGTRSEYATDIATSGLRVSTRGCYYDEDVPRIYLSPSIEYCAHSRYAKPWKKVERNGKTRWFQLIFQCRVNPKAVKKIRAETLLNEKHKDNVRIDPNFNNNELEWIIPGKEECDRMDRNIICYGLMMRVSDVNPEQLSSSAWWKYCYGD